MASELGVSQPRACQLVARYRADMLRPEPTNDVERWLLANGRVTLRTRKALAQCGYENDLAALAAEGPAWLFKLRNIGVVTVRAVAEALAALGLIEDADRWVTSGQKRAKSLRGLRPRRRTR